MNKGKEALYCYNNLAYHLTFSDEQLVHIANALQDNSTCKAIVFGKNYIGYEGCRNLATVLNNETLKYLSIGYNSIMDAGVEYIANALRSNTTLVGLSLVGNEIGDEGAKCLASAIAENETLASVNLCHNMIGNSGVEALRDALTTNEVLVAIDLRDNPVDKSELTLLNARLMDNRFKQKQRYEEIMKSAEVTGEWNRAKVILVGKERVSSFVPESFTSDQVCRSVKPQQ